MIALRKRTNRTLFGIAAGLLGRLDLHAIGDEGQLVEAIGLGGGEHRLDLAGVDGARIGLAHLGPLSLPGVILGDHVERRGHLLVGKPIPLME